MSSQARNGELALSLVGINAGYGKTQILFDVDLKVPAGEVVALIGSNGAGKTTLLRVASGLIAPMGGRIRISSQDATEMPSHRRARMGICLIPEGRGIFRSLTVAENLELLRAPWVDKQAVDIALSAFPVLGERYRQIAGSLSGGEQQMLSLSRAFMNDARTVLLDEVSMGLAPVVVDQIFNSLQQLKDRSTSVLIVEQYVNRALDMADFAYVMAKGCITWSGPAKELDRGDVLASYLGQSDRALS